jgi:AcrR family transcriptional regulator
VPRRSDAAVADSRQEVLEEAVLRASVTGLEGLTIGRLANEVEMSKSGLFGLFGSKLDLQRATLEAGIELFLNEVWRPVRHLEPGLPRLRGVVDCWLSYHERRRLPGGCFLTTAAVEFDARPGPLRDFVAEAWKGWIDLLARDVGHAIDAGQLPADTDPYDIAFELMAIASAASTQFLLSDRDDVFDRARRLTTRLLAG